MKNLNVSMMMRCLFVDEKTPVISGFHRLRNKYAPVLK